MSKNVPALVLTSDKTNWCLGPMAYLWNKYIGADWPVTVAGFSIPEFELPANFRFVSLGRFENFPVDRWGLALYHAVDLMGDQPFIFLLEDHWPIRFADRSVLRILRDYLSSDENADVLRIDLTADRVQARNENKQPAAVDVATVMHLDIIETRPPVEYLMSTQAAIWRPENLKPLIKAEETPWQFELIGSHRVAAAGLRVLGTRNFPFRHTVAVQRGVPDLAAGWMVPPSPVRRADIQAMIEAGALPLKYAMYGGKRWGS